MARDPSYTRTSFRDLDPVGVRKYAKLHNTRP